MAASPFAAVPGVPEDDGKLAGNRWHRGSPFIQKATDLPGHIIDKVPIIWLSAFIGIVDKMWWTKLPRVALRKLRLSLLLFWGGEGIFVP